MPRLAQKQVKRLDWEPTRPRTSDRAARDSAQRLGGVPSNDEMPHTIGLPNIQTPKGAAKPPLCDCGVITGVMAGDDRATIELAPSLQRPRRPRPVRRVAARRLDAIVASPRDRAPATTPAAPAAHRPGNRCQRCEALTYHTSIAEGGEATG